MPWRPRGSRLGTHPQFLRLQLPVRLQRCGQREQNLIRISHKQANLSCTGF